MSRKFKRSYRHKGFYGLLKSKEIRMSKELARHKTILQFLMYLQDVEMTSTIFPDKPQIDWEELH